MVFRHVFYPAECVYAIRIKKAGGDVNRILSGDVNQPDSKMAGQKNGAFYFSVLHFPVLRPETMTKVE